MPRARPRWTSPGWVITLVAVLVMALAGLAAIVKLTKDEHIPLATNGVGVGAVITNLSQNADELCLSDVVVPAGTSGVALWLGYHDASAATLRGTLALRGGPTIAVPNAPVGLSAGFQTLSLASTVKAERRGRLCVERVGSGPQLDVAGATVVRRASERPATVNGRSLSSVEPSLRLVASANTSTSGLGLIGDGLHRLAALSPSGFPPWAMAVVLFGLVPAALLLLVWNLATAPRRPVWRVATWCVLASLGLTVSWAIVTPVFQGPDESEHFAYAQHLAQTGDRADPSRTSTRPPYSTQVSAAISVLRNNAVVIDPAARNPWTDTTRRDLNDTDHLPGSDGGGYTDSASGHSALYYRLLSPAIVLAGDSVTAQLFSARLMTAVMAAFIAGLAAWAASFVVPGRRRTAALAGLAAATIPIAASVGGTVNNDPFLNLVAAGAFVAVLAMLVDPRRSIRWFAAAGALVMLMPLVKVSGIGLTAAFAGATGVAILMRWRDGLLSILTAAGATVGGAGALVGILALAAGPLVDGQTLTLFNVHPPIAGEAVGPALSSLARFDYVLQTFVPFIHLQGDHFPPEVPLYRIYVMGTWGGFGWNRLYLPTSLNTVIGWTTGLAILIGFVALYRQRALFARRKLATLAIALTPLLAIAFVAAVYAVAGGRAAQPEQGRYLMIALVPLSLWFVALPGAFGPGRLRQVATGAVAGTLCAATCVGLLVATSGWVA